MGYVVTIDPILHRRIHYTGNVTCGRMDIRAKSTTRASVCRNRNVNFAKHRQRVSIIDLKIDPLPLSDNLNSRSTSKNSFSLLFLKFFFCFFISLLFGVRVAGSSTRSNTSYRTKFARNCARVACDFERGVVNALHFPSRDFANGRTRAEFWEWMKNVQQGEGGREGGKEGRLESGILYFFFFFFWKFFF